MTLEQIGSMLGVTRERVRQLRDRAIAALRSGQATEVLRDWAA
jgi:RNA polymerase primary sigma factor